jgi:hypothetical protein
VLDPAGQPGHPEPPQVISHLARGVGGTGSVTKIAGSHMCAGHNLFASAGGQRAQKPSADPTLVRTRHLPPLLARGSHRDQDHAVRSNAEAQSPAGGCSAGTSLHISGCLAPSRRGNAALRSPASAAAPEQPVLDVRNQPTAIVGGVPNELGGYLRGRAKTQVAVRNRLPRSAV